MTATKRLKLDEKRPEELAICLACADALRFKKGVVLTLEAVPAASRS